LPFVFGLNDNTHDELDQTMKIPQRHIPARFVTLIPSEFPISKGTKQRSKKKSTSKSQTVTTRKTPIPVATESHRQDTESALFDDFLTNNDLGDLDDFDAGFDFGNDDLFTKPLDTKKRKKIASSSTSISISTDDPCAPKVSKRVRKSVERYE